MITLANMTQHTLQEVFDVVATHLLTQSKKAQRKDTGECLYRTAEGLRCAVGCLIPDELYDPAMERIGIATVTAMALMSAQFSMPQGYEPYIYLLRRLQNVHDRAYPLTWNYELTQLAKELKLTFFSPLTPCVTHK